VFKHSEWNFIIVDMRIMDDVNYFVVKACC
jgi:hypothetical protein